MGPFIFAIILTFLPLLLYYYFTRTFNYWNKRNVVAPKPLPLVGNMIDVCLRRKNIGLVFEEIYNMFPEEKVVGIYSMTTPNLLIRDLDIIKHIMIKDFDTFMDRGFNFGKEGLAANLFGADGDTWRTLRSRFTPLFTSGKLKNMFYLMEERADTFMDFMETECCKNPEQEIRNLVQKYTISSISACAFGVNIDTLGDKLDALKEIDRLTLTPSLVQEIDMIFPGIFKNMSALAFPKAVQKFFFDLVKNVMIQRDGKPTNRNDFMDLILELRQQGTIQSKEKFGEANVSLEITESVMAAQAFVFYIAGYETSATTLSYVLHEIAIQPSVQDKLIVELDESLRVNDGKITYNSLKEMKYMDKVINETLRLHSIVEPLQRQARVDYTIPGTDVVVKKGQKVYISPRGIHRDEKYYDNPEVFDPERFSPEVAGERHSCAYLPFGTGPRNCIGMRFGQIQTRLCLAKILSTFRVEPSINTKKILEVEPNRVIIGPKGEVYVNFVRRI